MILSDILQNIIYFLISIDFQNLSPSATICILNFTNKQQFAYINFDVVLEKVANHVPNHVNSKSSKDGKSSTKATDSASNHSLQSSHKSRTAEDKNLSNNTHYSSASSGVPDISNQDSSSSSCASVTKENVQRPKTVKMIGSKFRSTGNNNARAIWLQDCIYFLRLYRLDCCWIRWRTKRLLVDEILFCFEPSTRSTVSFLFLLISNNIY